MHQICLCFVAVSSICTTLTGWIGIVCTSVPLPKVSILRLLQPLDVHGLTLCIQVYLKILISFQVYDFISYTMYEVVTSGHAYIAYDM